MKDSPLQHETHVRLATTLLQEFLLHQLRISVRQLRERKFEAENRALFYANTHSSLLKYKLLSKCRKPHEHCFS